MTRLRRVHFRLAAILVALAVTSVLIATLASLWAVDTAVQRFGRADLRLSAEHAAAEGALLYGTGRPGWTPRKAAQLAALERVEGHTVVVRDASGRLVSRPMQQRRPRVVEAVRVGGAQVGTVSLAHQRGDVLRLKGSGGTVGEFSDALHEQIRLLHIGAGVLAVILALVLALVLAARLAKPIRRLTDAAEDIEAGRVDVEVDVGKGAPPEFRSLAGTLQRVAATLKQQEDVRKETVSDLAHELRTPVTGLRARIEAAQDGVITDLPAALASMHEDVLRLGRLMDDLQRLAAAQRPGLLLDKAHVDLTQLTRNRARAFAGYFASKGISLLLDLDPAYTLGDAERLGQVVDNLLSNALRYTDEGGRVILRLVDHGDQVLIEVADTGIGIPPDQLPRIFDRFWRGDKSRSRATGGSGLGLALVRELVVAHDGRVDVLSAPGQGSRFRVYLPSVPRQHDRVPTVRFSTHAVDTDVGVTPVTVAELPSDVANFGWPTVERDLIARVHEGATSLVLVVPGSGALNADAMATILAVQAQIKARSGRLAVARRDSGQTMVGGVIFADSVEDAIAAAGAAGAEGPAPSPVTPD